MYVYVYIYTYTYVYTYRERHESGTYHSCSPLKSGRIAMNPQDSLTAGKVSDGWGQVLYDNSWYIGCSCNPQTSRWLVKVSLAPSNRLSNVGNWFLFPLPRLVLMASTCLKAHGGVGLHFDLCEAEWLWDPCPMRPFSTLPISKFLRGSLCSVYLTCGGWW